MPLLSGSSKEVISENIRTERHAGKTEAQAIAIAMRMAGKSKPKMTHHSSGQMKTIKPTKKGQKPLHFKEGGLHASTGTAPDKKISPAKHAAAASGKLGPKAERQEQFYQNVLKH